jgi:hypothetical protein
MQKIRTVIVVGLVAAFAGASAAWASPRASLAEGQYILQVGETAEFAIKSATSQSSDLHAWCELSAGGPATVTFDGDHYVPLSEPAVGDIVTLAAGQTRRIELQGTIEANDGSAYIAFAFTGVPAAMCFPGMKCDGATSGARDVKVRCGND